MTGALKKKQTEVTCFPPECPNCETCKLSSNDKASYLTQMHSSKYLIIKWYCMSKIYFRKHAFMSLGQPDKTNEIFKANLQKWSFWKFEIFVRKAKFWFETRILFKTIMSSKKSSNFRLTYISFLISLDRAYSLLNLRSLTYFIS